jgi:hypothetical protein
VLIVNGRRTPVQIVTVPSSATVWKDLNANNAATLSGDRGAAVSILRAAIAAKSVKAKGTILALDLAPVGAIVNGRLVEAYLAAFGDAVTSKRVRRRHDLAALFARAKFLIVEKIFVRLRDRILGIVAHDEALFVQQVVALRAIPMKAIDFAVAPLAL